ncbi:hypothetical protein OV203_35745 [Nannocystis sp. ILAH1]|uniref:hypothetical protein n=1 Tax=unclassified Nannocystis TaxID=2627009 RepID=UPI002270D3B4|nr:MULTISPECIES: hypothetical protein [unclassified Nannocystis]MCY0992548.1 hypothetical protein [Nannocystis sp. ILAH1]MCY1070225.1 hypothetical protein [Nannocystis sp. RBIL2]
MKYGPGGLTIAVLAVFACGDDGRPGLTGSSASAGTAAATSTGAASSSASEVPTTTGGSASATESSTDASATGPSAGTSTTATTEQVTSSTTETSTTGESETTETSETTAAGCEAQPEVCDALDNNCNDLFDEGCDCTPPDLELEAIEGYTARVVFDVPMQLGAYGYLGDVERALGEYWSEPGEGVLFTVNNPQNTASGIGLLDQDGGFKGWLIDPADAALPINPYLEYAYGGVLYTCHTVNVNEWIYKIYPDGTTEQVVQHGNCEGLIYGDRGDGTASLYASNYGEDAIYRIGEDGSRTAVAQGPDLDVVVDLAIPPPTSMFKPGLYAINQTHLGVHRLDAADVLSLDYPYSLGFGIGEEMSFAAPTSAFRDHFYHLSATLQAVVRVAPDGSWETVLTGPKLNYGLYSTGGVFSSNGAFYFFTNEDALIMRLQACNIAGQ